MSLFRGLNPGNPAKRFNMRAILEEAKKLKKWSILEIFGVMLVENFLISFSESYSYLGFLIVNL